MWKVLAILLACLESHPTFHSERCCSLLDEMLDVILGFWVNDVIQNMRWRCLGCWHLSSSTPISSDPPAGSMTSRHSLVYRVLLWFHGTLRLKKGLEKHGCQCWCWHSFHLEVGRLGCVSSLKMVACTGRGAMFGVVAPCWRMIPGFYG